MLKRKGPEYQTKKENGGKRVQKHFEALREKESEFFQEGEKRKEGNGGENKSKSSNLGERGKNRTVKREVEERKSTFPERRKKKKKKNPARLKDERCESQKSGQKKEGKKSRRYEGRREPKEICHLSLRKKDAKKRERTQQRKRWGESKLLQGIQKKGKKGCPTLLRKEVDLGRRHLKQGSSGEKGEKSGLEK